MQKDPLGIAEDGTGDGRLWCDFSKRDSAYEHDDNVVCSHLGCAPCPVPEQTGYELNDALVAVDGNCPHLRVRMAEFGA